MTLYKITYTTEQWCNAFVEANTPEEAEEKFWQGDAYGQAVYGGEIQENIDVEKVETE